MFFEFILANLSKTCSNDNSNMHSMYEKSNSARHIAHVGAQKCKNSLAHLATTQTTNSVTLTALPTLTPSQMTECLAQTGQSKCVTAVPLRRDEFSGQSRVKMSVSFHAKVSRIVCWLTTLKERFITAVVCLTHTHKSTHFCVIYEWNKVTHTVLYKLRP